MGYYFDTLRKEILYKKIKQATIRAIIVSGFVCICLFCTMMVHIWFLVFFLMFVWLLIREGQTLRTANYLAQDIRHTQFYQQIKKYEYSYFESIQDISERLQEDCLYAEGNIYIIKNWILDFNTLDVRVFCIDELVWIYQETGFGFLYRYFISTMEKKKRYMYPILHIVFLYLKNKKVIC